MLEMFMDYSFVLKGKAKETQDTDGEVAEDTSQQVAYLHRIIFSPRSIDFYLTLLLGWGFCHHHSSVVCSEA